MAIHAASKFHGLIPIVAGANDAIAWFEDDGAGNTANLSTTLAPAASYYPGTDTEAGTLCKMLKDAMETASDAGAIGTAHGGSGVDYAVSINYETGLITITASGSGFSPTWYPKVTSAESNKFLCGGDPSVNGTRERGHFGWNRDAAYPSAATSHTSDAPPAYSWHPGMPPLSDDLGVPEATVAEAISFDGHQDVADYVGDVDGVVIRTLAWDFILTAARSYYEDEFWRPYAKQGGRFRFYKDGSDDDTYTIYTLTGDSLARCIFAERRSGYPYWQGQLQILEYRS